MSSQNFGLTTGSLAEIALVVSRVARQICDESVLPTPASLRSFWHSSRLLQRRWTQVLDDWTVAGRYDIDTLEDLAPRVFTCEMAVRTWSTVLSVLDQQRGSADLTRVARNTVLGLQQVRHGILSRLLALPEIERDRVLNLDRLRRRCDRWTDLLIGPLAVSYECFEFAYDPERARDFGEEGIVADPATGPHAIEHLVSAGLRLTFLQHLPMASIVEPEITSLMQSILANLPRTAFHRDGSLRSLLERRIVVSREQHVRPVPLLMGSKSEPEFHHD